MVESGGECCELSLKPLWALKRFTFWPEIAFDSILIKIAQQLCVFSYMHVYFGALVKHTEYLST